MTYGKRNRPHAMKSPHHPTYPYTHKWKPSKQADMDAFTTSPPQNSEPNSNSHKTQNKTQSYTKPNAKPNRKRTNTETKLNRQCKIKLIITEHCIKVNSKVNTNWTKVNTCKLSTRKNALAFKSYGYEWKPSKLSRKTKHGGGVNPSTHQHKTAAPHNANANPVF